MKKHTVVDRVVYYIIAIFFIALLNACSHITYSNVGYTQSIPNYSIYNASNYNNSTMIIKTTNPDKTYIYNYNDPNRFPSHTCTQHNTCNHN
jgi:hypothetical protein